MNRNTCLQTLVWTSALLLSCAGTSLAQEPAVPNAPSTDSSQNAPSADNTKVNQRDRSGSEPTADQQKNNISDRDLTKEIRKAIIEDKSLSTYAHNVKVISQGGQVTLKGPVESEEEKQAIESKAAAIAGQGKVTNELSVKPKS